MKSETAVTPFRVEIPQRDLDDLHERLARTLWPQAGPGAGWSRGAAPGSRPRSPRTSRHIASSNEAAMRGSWRLRWPSPMSWRRSLPSQMLTVGWLCPSRSAVRVTLRVV